MRHLRRGLAVAALLAVPAVFAPAEDVVVLKGGSAIRLKQPWVRRGNTAYLTRADGTLLSVPVSEIDREATAAAQTAPPPPPVVQSAPASTPGEVARVAREGPKARVRITDADVSHPLEYQALAGEPTAAPEALGGPRVEVADYTYEKTGPALIVRGTLRNPGQGSADGVRLNVSAFDGKGLPIGGATASLSKGNIESGTSIAFTASMAIGEQTVGSLRFAPQWTGAAPAAPAAPAGSRPAPAADRAAPGTGASAQTAPPQPAPTPYGRGNLYAAPVANAPSEAPADGKTGYIPGATSPDNQPKPPSR